MIAVIRVRGTVNVNPHLKKTMEMLRLFRPNNMAVVTQAEAKMVEKVKDYVTYGPISGEILAATIEKRGKLEGDKKVTVEFLQSKKINGFNELAKQLIDGKAKLKDLGIEPMFRLHPPKKGHKRKGIKVPFTLGGALGNRKEQINELIARMI